MVNLSDVFQCLSLVNFNKSQLRVAMITICCESPRQVVVIVTAVVSLRESVRW